MINQHLTSLAMALHAIDSEVPQLQSWAGTAASVLAAGGQILICGSDAGAKQAEYLAAELADGDGATAADGSRGADCRRLRRTADTRR